MASLIGILGPSGDGKSTSIRTLNPEETYIIGVAGKELPFKGANKLYSREKKNYIEVSTSVQINQVLDQINAKAPHIKHIVIDDIQYVMGFEFVNRATEIGYTKFSQIAQNMFTIFQKVRTLRPDLKVYCLGHSEPVESDGQIVAYKMKTVGKLLDEKINLEGLFTVCLYTRVTTDKDDKPLYQFITNKYKIYPAKSPMGMFDEQFIPNDLQYVANHVDAFFNADV